MMEVIRELVGELTSLSVPLTELDDQADLHDAGMSSFEMVSLLVAVEKRFGVRFDSEALARETFSSIASICAAVRRAGYDE